MFSTSVAGRPVSSSAASASSRAAAGARCVSTTSVSPSRSRIAALPTAPRSGFAITAHTPSATSSISACVMRNGAARRPRAGGGRAGSRASRSRAGTRCRSTRRPRPAPIAAAAGGPPRVPDAVRVRLEEARRERRRGERRAPGVEVDDRAPLREADVEEAVVQVRAVAEVERLPVLEPLGERRTTCPGSARPARAAGRTGRRSRPSSGGPGRRSRRGGSRAASRPSRP